MKEKSDYNIGDSVFWILIVLMVLSGMSYLGIWSYHNNSIQGALLSSMFFAMIISGIVLSRFQIFDMGTWGENTFSFMLGFGLWMLIGSFFGTQSVLSVSQNQLYSTIAGELPELLNFVMNVIVIPISEEIFWMIALPFGLFSIMHTIGKKVDWINNAWFQIFVVCIVGGITFGIFHVSNFFLPFLISAFIFRSTLVILVWGDKMTDWIKPVKLIVAFAVGGHIANNMFAYGLQRSWFIITNYFASIGWMILTLFLVIFISAINYFITTYILRTNKVGVRG